MTNEYQDSDDIKKELFFYLGIIATKFATLESMLLKFLGKLIDDDFVLTNTLFEKNSLSQNIDHIKKINRLRNFKEDEVSQLLAEVSQLKNKRNTFIHSIWVEPSDRFKDEPIICISPRMKYTEDEKVKSWSSTTVSEFKISDLKTLIIKVNKVLSNLKALNSELENEQVEATGWKDHLH